MWTCMTSLFLNYLKQFEQTSPSEQTPYIWFGPPQRSLGPFKQTSPPQWFGPDPYWHGSVGTSNGSHGGIWKGEHWYVKFKKMKKDLKFMIG